MLLHHAWSCGDYGCCNYGCNAGYDGEGGGGTHSNLPSLPLPAYVGGKTQIPQLHLPEYPEGTSPEWEGRSSPALGVLGPGGPGSAQEKAAGGGSDGDA